MNTVSFAWFAAGFVAALLGMLPLVQQWRFLRATVRKLPRFLIAMLLWPECDYGESVRVYRFGNRVRLAKGSTVLHDLSAEEFEIVRGTLEKALWKTQ